MTGRGGKQGDGGTWSSGWSSASIPALEQCEVGGDSSVVCDCEKLHMHSGTCV